MTIYDLRLHDGRIFLPEVGLTRADLLLMSGKIAGIVGSDAPGQAKETIDLRSAVVLPGAIDPHVHLGKDIRFPKNPDDALPETASAAAGGVTSMLVYLMSSDPYEKTFSVAQAAMSGHSYADFGYHLCLGTREHVKAIGDYVRDLGVSSFKFFMNFRGDEGSYLGLPANDDGFMYDLLGMAADNNSMINPHPENIEIVWRLREETAAAPDGPLEAWRHARPSFVEAEALQRVAYFGSVTGASVYAVHTSSSAALDAVRRQRADYANLFVETCAHYLTLTTSADCGTYGKVNPPLRTAADQEALWEGIAAGAVDTVGSDHNARHRSFKEKDIWNASAGFPGVGVMLGLTLSEGLKRGVPLSRLVDITSTRAAKLFGLYPRKGVIRVGSDADLAIVDLDATSVINAHTQHSAAEYTPWEGTEVSNRIIHTLVRGQFAVRDGKLSANPVGVYLPRERSGSAALAAQAEAAGE